MKNTRRFGRDRLVRVLSVAGLCFVLSTLVFCQTPDAITNLSWQGVNTLTWSADANAGSYRVYKGEPEDLAGLPNVDDDMCLRGDFSITHSGPIQEANPSSGSFFWFLVTGVGVGGEGPVAGSSSTFRTTNTTGGCCGEVSFAEDFPGADDDAWPNPWSVTAGVADADIQGGASRLSPLVTSYSLARMVVPGDLMNGEVTFRMQFEDIDKQGIGFYLRSNGGYLAQTNPTGQGYAVFLEGFRGTPGIGLWREVYGSEQDMTILFDNALNFQNDTWYQVRFRVQQLDAFATLTQARVWLEGTTEPATWQIEFTDTHVLLQELSGGFAIDSWNYFQSGDPTPLHTFVDDVRITRVCLP